jgi:chromosomal replication initiator protein
MTVTRIESEPSTLKSEYTFDRFIKGDGNLLACSACQAVAESPGRAYNPLFIYGQVGLGKTHLLYAIGNELVQHQPWLRVIYLTSERFAIELVQSIRENRTDRFRRIYRQVDALLIDDVHFLKDKEGTQEELFHTFNELYENSKQIVLSSDRPPEELSQLQERLVSRFRWGLVADIQPPNFETRLAIVRAKAKENSLELTDELLTLIARRVTSSVRALEGALIRAAAYADLQGQSITPGLLEEVLPQEVPSKPSVDIAAIKAEVARRYEVTVEQLEGERREKRISQARHIAIYLARELTNGSFPTIGRAFGARDHTTVMHAYRKVSDLLKTPLFRNEIEELTESLRAGSPARIER